MEPPCIPWFPMYRTPFISCREGFAHHTGLGALWSQESDRPVWIPVQPQGRPAGLVPLLRHTDPGLAVLLCAYLYLSYINSCYKDKEGEAEGLGASGQHYTPGTVLKSFLCFTSAPALMVMSYSSHPLTSSPVDSRCHCSLDGTNSLPAGLLSAPSAPTRSSRHHQRALPNPLYHSPLQLKKSLLLALLLIGTTSIFHLDQMLSTNWPSPPHQ